MNTTNISFRELVKAVFNDKSYIKKHFDTNTNNIIKVNIHVFNKFTDKNEIVKVSVRANSVMELCERLAGVNGRILHYLLARPELFNETRYFFPCFTKEFKNYLYYEKEMGPCHRFMYDGISLDK